MSSISTLKPAPGIQTQPSRWPKWLRRGPMELVACGLITLGILMLLQPFALVLFTWSFATMLLGTIMFVVVSKFPQ
jgi:hypothetical protein